MTKKQPEPKFKYSDDPNPQWLKIQQDITDYFNGEYTLKELCCVLSQDVKPKFEYIYDNYEEEAFIFNRYERFETDEEVKERLILAKHEREEYAKKIQNAIDRKNQQLEIKKNQVAKLLKEIEEMSK